MAENDKAVRIATVVIQSPTIDQPKNQERTDLLVDVISKCGKFTNVLVFPAGFYFQSQVMPYRMYATIKKTIKEVLCRNDLDITICLGIDGRNHIDQVGLAINKEGIISVGRKFYPTGLEKDYIELAESYISQDDNYSRIFKARGMKFYIAICYDGFGIRKQNIENPDVDAILNLVHGFNPIGGENSGDVYFAKYSFAGSSKQWGCPTFGSAVFSARSIPERWPTGVMWNQGDKNVQRWHYEDNPLKPHDPISVMSQNEKAEIKIYTL